MPVYQAQLIRTLTYVRYVTFEAPDGDSAEEMIREYAQGNEDSDEIYTLDTVNEEAYRVDLTENHEGPVDIGPEWWEENS